LPEWAVKDYPVWWPRHDYQEEQSWPAQKLSG